LGGSLAGWHSPHSRRGPAAPSPQGRQPGRRAPRGPSLPRSWLGVHLPAPTRQLGAPWCRVCACNTKLLVFLFAAPMCICNMQSCSMFTNKHTNEHIASMNNETAHTKIFSRAGLVSHWVSLDLPSLSFMVVARFVVCEGAPPEHMITRVPLPVPGSHAPPQ
jgi:hypothetical protein